MSGESTPEEVLKVEAGARGLEVDFVWGSREVHLTKAGASEEREVGGAELDIDGQGYCPHCGRAYDDLGDGQMGGGEEG